MHLEFGNKKGWSINLPFLCNKCGKCCKLDDFLTAGKLNAEPQEYVEVQDKAKNLFEELGKMWEADQAKYDKYITQKPCPFLVNNSCSIYEIRPDGCRLFPKTAFGMQDSNCAPLLRFKKMAATLRKQRPKTEKYYFTGKIPCLSKCDETIKPVNFTEKQYQICITNLREAGMTDNELTLFDYFNKK